MGSKCVGVLPQNFGFLAPDRPNHPLPVGQRIVA